jgi:hypothetical protein
VSAAEACFARDAATGSLEGSVLRFWFSLTLAGLLVAFALPLFAIRRCLADFGTTVASFLPGFRWRRRSANFEQQRLWPSDEFGFEHAIQAYEELIDVHVAHVWRRE